MAKVVAIRRNNKDKGGLAPIAIRVFLAGVVSYKHVGFEISEKDWDENLGRVKKSNPLAGKINLLIAKFETEAQEKVLDFQNNGTAYNYDKLQQLDFITFALKSIEQANITPSTRKMRTSVLAKLKGFKAKIAFSELTYDFAMAYRKHLIDLGNNDNTVYTNIKVLRMIVRDAAKRGYTTTNAFADLDVKYKNPAVEFLTDSELLALEQVNATGILHLVKCLFLFNCYNGGLRISEVLTLEKKAIETGYIKSTSLKTGKAINIPITPKGAAILELIPESENPYVFGLFKEGKSISMFTALVNKYLKKLAAMAGIEKDLHSHIARHTFATKALRDGMRIEYVSNILGHANLRETQIYAKIIDSEAHKEMMKVFK